METKEPSVSRAMISGSGLDWVETLIQQASRIRFGTIEITVVNQRVIQLETSERVRFPNLKTDQTSGGK
jgi:hypothetical protein